jgi:hypothetical protein
LNEFVLSKAFLREYRIEYAAAYYFPAALINFLDPDLHGIAMEATRFSPCLAKEEDGEKGFNFIDFGFVTFGNVRIV